VYADLHLHTRFSDGTFTPEELAEAASHHQLKAIALTDHDTVEGCLPTAMACRERDIEFIPGSELTAQVPGGAELHILGYFLDTTYEPLLRRLAHFQEVRQERIRLMVGRLNEIGVPLEADAVFQLAGCRAPGRPHVARALVQAGHCVSSDDAFERYLKMNRPAWVSKEKMTSEEAIALIHEAGGVAVMAHPGLNRCDDAIPELARLGLDGIECYHTRHTGAEADRYRRMADGLKLLVSGGSDCHGYNKGQPLIGGVKLPYSFVERIRERHEARVGSVS
jgi:3',5'-nucleoside bisphosphate phosphatase